jgi:hypothetical protein
MMANVQSSYSLIFSVHKLNSSNRIEVMCFKGVVEK